MVAKTEAVEHMTDIMVKFVGYSGKILPDGATEKLKEFRVLETDELPETIYGTIFRNQELAAQLGRPCCQDTGILQYLVECGTRFPLIDFVGSLLKETTVKATFDTPLHHSSVETFNEYSTGKNVGKGTPIVFWEIVPKCDTCEIYSYMAGEGCSLPGKTMVLMPSQGYEGVTKFVLDVTTNYGLNACPPLLVDVGVAASVGTAALLSKRALFRTLGSKNSSEEAAKSERLLEDGVNKIGLGPQGVSGEISVTNIRIEDTARHPSTVGVTVDVGCRPHRKGHTIFDEDLRYTIVSHGGVTL